MHLEQEEISDVIRWLIKLRWIGCVGVLIATFIVRDISGLDFSIIPAIIILCFVASYNLFFDYLYRSRHQWRNRFTLAQIGLDYIALAAAVYFSGGIGSPLLYFYVFHVVISGIVLPSNWIFRVVMTGIALPLIVEFMSATGILPASPEFRFRFFETNPSIAVACGAVFVCTMILTAYFLLYLVTRLHKRQDKLNKYYQLAESLKSTIVMDEIIGIIKEDFLSLASITNICYMRFNHKTIALEYKKPEAERQAGIEESVISMPLTEQNPLTETFLSCIACVLYANNAETAAEKQLFAQMMKNAKEVVVLPVWSTFAKKCYEFFHCTSDKNCPAYNSPDPRCWTMPGTMCKGTKKDSLEEKLKDCADCDMFMPEGLFILDVTRHRDDKEAFDLDVCIGLLDTASLAISNAKLYEKTVKLSQTDSLTGFKNRRTFFALMDAEINRSKRYEKKFGLMMLDIDHFKNYNDTNGHPEGDALLRSLAEVLNSATRGSDIIGRYGGEEFIVLFTETTKDAVLMVAERMRAAVEAHPFPHREKQPQGKLTISIGVSVFPENGNDTEQLLQAADAALYAAKKNGRNRVVAA
ncbi:MAG: GGDEF domain-containing protein [Nitrospirae bacterium]|nr:GGDEF domain-containing protein [Nitrospirota bacterium]